MARHWQAYANRPQWKLWIFLANRGDDDGLGGVMFDGDIDEPGGVDRQGTAVFTRCPVFHTPEGEYCAANPPADIAMHRELFFNLVHKTGHAFNLAHSFGKEGGAWQPPPWAPVAGGEQALSWMNYPDLAMPSTDRPMNASAFYRRFRMCRRRPRTCCLAFRRSRCCDGSSACGTLRATFRRSISLSRMRRCSLCGWRP